MTAFYTDNTKGWINLPKDNTEQLNRIEEKLDQLLAAQKKKYVQLRTVNK